MKISVKFFAPILFGIFSSFFYILLYHPVLGSEDFVTTLLVFSAALSWSAVIIFAPQGNQWILNLYLSFTFILLMVIVLFLKGFNIPLHYIAIGLIVLAVVGLRLFVYYNFKYKEEE